MTKPIQNQTKNDIVYIGVDELVDLIKLLSHARLTQSYLRDLAYRSVETSRMMSNDEKAHLIGGVKDILEFAETFDDVMQNGKVKVQDMQDDMNSYFDDWTDIPEEDYTDEDWEQLDKDTISNDAYSRWEHLK
tara:strand:+ start:634 stop:1032 length:399 start_codon:yes stop_codon:yes gene_type:complete